MSQSLKKFLIGAALLASACHTQLKPGLNALADGNYAKANKHARTGLKKDRDNPQLNLLLANALIGQERYRDAYPYARKAFESGELDGPAGRTLGKVYWELDQTVDAVRTWRVARSVDVDLVPTDEYIRAVERAVEVSEKGADPLSEVELRAELATLQPDHPQATDAMQRAAKEKLAAAHARNGAYEEALAVFEELSARYPDHPSYPFERGRLLSRLHDIERAIAAFDAYVAIGDPAQAADRMQDAASEAESLSAFRVAIHFAKQAIDALPATDHEALARLHLRVGTILLSLGAMSEGAEYVKTFVRLRNEHSAPTVAHYLRGATVATSYNHIELAASLLEEAVSEGTPDWWATRRLAELYAQQGRTEDVERVLHLLVERSDDPTTRLSVGEWAAGRRNFELARFFLEDAVAKDKEVLPATWLRLARVYAALGQIGDVRRSLNNYASSAHDKRIALIEIAAIYRAQRMYDEAEKSLVEARRIAPEDVLVVNLLEEVYREWGRPAKIHEVYQAWLKARGNRPEDFATVGDRFFRNQQYDDALVYLTRAAKAGQHEVWLQIADIYSQQHKERDMKAALDSYLAASTNRGRALNAVLQRYRVGAWSHEAIPILEELIELEPRNVMHYEQLSQFYFQFSRDAEAFELWKRFITHSDNPIAALETMARRFQRQQHVDWMVQLLHQFVDGDPSPDPRLYRLLGDAYSDRNAAQAARNPRNAVDSGFVRQDKAKHYYELFLEHADPALSDLQVFAESMRRKGHWSIAASTYERLLREDVELHPHHLINYATALLHIGEVTRAEEMFAQVHAARSDNLESAVAISDQLFAARRYRAAEPYLRKVLREANDDTLLRQAFFKLGELYRNSDRVDSIGPIINEYLNRVQDPREARRNIHMMLESVGLWELAAEHLETLSRDQREVSFELGENLYRAGQYDRAHDAFRDYAANDPSQVAGWQRVATFYVTRGEVDHAESAFRNVLSAAPDDAASYLGLGHLLATVGRVDEANQLFESARARVPATEHAKTYETQVQALMQVGAHDAAREVARTALSASYVDRWVYYQVLAPPELSSGDPVRSQRMADEVANAGLNLNESVELLRTAGLIEQAAALIDREIAQGDHILGGRTLLSNLDIFAMLGGVDRVMRSAQPLLEGRNLDSNLLMALGAWLEAEGHAKQGVMLMRRAYSEGATPSPGQLSSAYAALGEHDEAFRVIQLELGQSREQDEIALYLLGARYSLLGELDRFTQILEHLVRDVRFAPAALPLLLRHYAEVGDVSVIVDIVERAVAFPTNESGVPINDAAVEHATMTLVAGVQELASAGYHAEARALLQQLPPSVAERSEVEDLRLRLAVFASVADGDAAQQLRESVADLGTTGDDADMRLHVVALAISAGEYDLAKELVTPLIASPNFTLSSNAMRMALRVARASASDPSEIGTILSTYFGATDDVMTARNSALEMLAVLGFDEQAYTIAAQQAASVPTFTTVRTALIGAQQTGDAEGVARWSVRLKDIDRQDPIQLISTLQQHWILRQEDQLTQPLTKLVEARFGEALNAKLTSLRHEYRQGNAFEAREQLLKLANDSKFDAVLVEGLLVTLFNDKLYGEVARVLGPQVPPEKLTVASRRAIGLANMALGFDTDGLEQLDRLIAVAPDAAVEATIVADTLLKLRKYRSALRYANIAVEKRPTRPDGIRVRGLARLATGDVERATEDLEEALVAGLGRDNLLTRATTIALRTGHPKIAEQFATQMLTGGRLTARFATRAYVETNRGHDGVELLERTRPHIAAGLSSAGDDLMMSLSQLYESNSQSQRSHDLYRHAIRRLELTTPWSSTLAMLRNNLAYGYSTTNLHIEDGLDLVYRAIAQSTERHASYIDTLGWLHYRQGDLALAETEVRRAIRASSGNPEELTELYHHLAVLREQQGFHGQAVWYQMFADAVKPLSD